MNHKVFNLKSLVSHQKLFPVYNLFGHKLKFYNSLNSTKESCSIQENTFIWCIISKSQPRWKLCDSVIYTNVIYSIALNLESTYQTKKLFLKNHFGVTKYCIKIAAKTNSIFPTNSSLRFSKKTNFKEEFSGNTYLQLLAHRNC